MDSQYKATSIDLFSFNTAPMRAFHMTWFAFFLCFFAWFGIAPLMSVVREELALTKAQVGNTIIASVAATVIARLIAGWACDRYGPRRTYGWLLVLGSIPVMGIGFATNYESFLLFRLGISIIGASFVITQFHTTMMFAPNVVGTANAATAGWGNLGGGVTQMVMPLLFSGFVAAGLTEFWSWRASMFLAGVVCFATGVAYYFVTRDTPEGDFRELRARGAMPKAAANRGAFWEAFGDVRVWALFVIYGGCFGVEITLDNIAALYFTDYFDLGIHAAGFVAAGLGLLNIFARALGGIVGDRFGLRWGLKGRVRWLAIVMACEALTLILFSQMTSLSLAIAALLLFGLFVCMGCGATYAVVPFINKRALGPVAGIVGAGGNVGALLSGFLFKVESLSWPQGLFVLGLIVFVCSVTAVVIRFSDADEAAAKHDIEQRLRATAEPALASA
ncbi:MAG: MFS transporter [Candidatus Hydrogenedentes bacterium]|nr:MFS transporter [Candidatus Hydrogenedentota bacterium]